MLSLQEGEQVVCKEVNIERLTTFYWVATVVGLLLLCFSFFAVFSVKNCNSRAILLISNHVTLMYIKIHRLDLTSKSDQIENMGRNILIKCSVFIAFLYTVRKLHNQEYNQLEQKQCAGMQLN